MNANESIRLQAIALCRVSTVKQSVEGSSMEVQDENARNTADYLKADLVKIWKSKGVSSRQGKNLTRKDLNEMLAYAKANKKVKFVIVDIADRFMRGGVKEHYYWSGRFDFEAGATLVYAQKHHLYEQAGTAMADFEEVMDVMKAKMSNDERIGKSSNGMQARVAAGYYPSNPKTGYMRSETPGLHVPKEPVWSMLRSGFLQVLEGIPIKDVVAGINAAGYKEKSGRLLDTHRFKVMLKDPFYAGIIKMSNWVVSPNGLHKAMITPEQHEQLKNIVKGVVYTPHKQYNPEFPLSKIMTCKECLEEGAKNPKIVGYTNHNGRGNSYNRYKCRACNKNYMLRDELHGELNDILSGLRLAEDKVKDFLAGLRHVWEQEQATSFNTAQALKTRLSSLTNDKKAIVLKQALGQLADDRADIAIEALDEDIATIRQQIESISSIEQDFVEFVEFALSTVEGFRDKFWELDQEHQVWCKQLLFPDGFSVSRDKKVYTPTISDFYLCINAEKSPKLDSSTAKSSLWYGIDYRPLPNLYEALIVVIGSWRHAAFVQCSC